MFRKNKIKTDFKKENHNTITINNDMSVFDRILKELIKINDTLHIQTTTIINHEQRITKLEEGGGK